MTVQTHDRELDVVLYGATGFVGRLTAAHLAAHAPAGTRIALAGRSSTKVEQVRADLGPAAAHWPVVVADSTDEASLAAMARRARVVISTVGPYALHGLPLVLACARAGTDYVDLTGEVLFVRRSIDAAHEVARASGARIVHSCGFDSVPSDLAVMMAAQRAADEGHGTLTRSTLYASMRGGLSGGTVASMREQLAQVAGSRTLRRLAADPYALSAERDTEPRGEYRDTRDVTHDPAVGAWTAPFLMESYNTRVVRRSNSLLGHGYGRGLRYREVMRTGRGLKGAATAYAVAGVLAAAYTAFGVPALTPLFDRVLPGTGEGPSEAAREAGWFRMELLTTTTDGTRYRSVVASDDDPGYDGTAVMLGEAALALALDRDSCPLPAGLTGGVLTPATAIGPVLAHRLAARGLTLGTARVDA